jgi:acyl-[acyl carrier protein]--UDP-N-acetylglucosamine O-acyltransferase
VSLRRRGFTRDQIDDMRRAYRLLFSNEGTLKERVDDVAEEFAKHPIRSRDARLYTRAKRQGYLHPGGTRRKRMLSLDDVGRPRLSRKP